MLNKFNEWIVRNSVFLLIIINGIASILGATPILCCINVLILMFFVEKQRTQYADLADRYTRLRERCELHNSLMAERFNTLEELINKISLN